MKALSIHQPWAWAILHAGKGVENRSWPTRYRGPLLVHASKSRASYEEQEPAAWLERYGIALPAWDELAKGAIVGVVDVVDCVRVEEIYPATPWAVVAKVKREVNERHGRWKLRSGATLF